MELTLSPNGDVTCSVEDSDITYVARDFRKSRGSWHATVGVYRDTRLLDEDDVSLRKREERNRLANAAYKQAEFTDEERAGYPVEHMQGEVLRFCRQAVAVHLEQKQAQRMKGSPERTPTEFVIEPYVVTGGGTIAYSPPKRGKSWTALLMAVSADSGTPTLFNVEIPTPTLFVNLERSEESLRQRLGDVNEVLGLDRERDMLFLNARGRSLTDVRDAVQASVEANAIELVVLDSLSRAGVGNLNENDAANDAMDALNSFGVAWLAVAHTPRGDESHVFGSQMFDAAADVMVQLLTEQQAHQLGIGLKITAANDVGSTKLQTLSYQFGDGLTTVRHAKPNEFPLIESGAAAMQDPATLLYNWVLTAGGPVTASEAAEGAGLSSIIVAQMLKNDDRFVFVRQEGAALLYAVRARELAQE